MNKKLYIILSIITPILFLGCSDKYIEQNDQEYFTKLYRANDDIEAIDFIIKPDKNGFLLLGNSKSASNSNLILFDLNRNGYVKKSIELKTDDLDAGKRIYLADNNVVYILGRRTKSNDQVVSIFLKADIALNFANYTDTTNYEQVRELAYNPDDINTSFIMEDMGIINETLILAGYLENNGRKNAICRSYDLNEMFNDIATPVSYINQLPLMSNIRYDNSSFKKIGLYEYDNYPVSIYGQRINNNGDLDISNYLMEDIQNFRFISPNINISKDQNLQAYHISNVDNSIIFAGNNQNNESGDSIFIMRSYYAPSLSGDSINYNILSTNYFSGIGTEIVDIAQTANGDLLIASLSDNIVDNEIQSRIGNILRFSFLANTDPVENISLRVAINGLQSIKKIKYDSDNNITYILSGVTLGTDETAIELSKVMF